jgi:hypothetical protein
MLYNITICNICQGYSYITSVYFEDLNIIHVGYIFYIAKFDVCLMVYYMWILYCFIVCSVNKGYIVYYFSVLLKLEYCTCGLYNLYCKV